MSVEPERVFSDYVLIYDRTDCRCNLTITDLRNRLGADTVEAIECLKWWVKGGFITEGLKSLMMNENDDAAATGLIEGLMSEDEDVYG